ncbi:MBL fold metallo-hydrolase RNA specificity domain-containing protein [Cytophaga hutchinsonii]|uniref:Metallo-beta-lactamase superfamily protein n=1 Tax=Cytophaga hutchinsonii (strain ATCC 33406 / DSM 1761 / CIP 103989 / NBRC 15051 / NCIMB 9469 / D465) TaxID=269798 RepID=A0A6N4SVS4_CYTH3|nr:MBL fold metallo-hydrolase [Cytophaga hutchinsonii]ABG60661.1 metallo-beta-lactamase superfamily protein [Cytophaga hutchinsonii ATCC 33406]SFY01473.1 metallo-beta-lactamase family protein [Cytophaga hutchinsonii ATCC 33406]
MKLTFWGAARKVTGSMYLLESLGYKILIDCGSDFSDRHKVLTGGLFPFEASEIDLVILTHAHVDHSGNIPALIRAGYRGQILSTAPTAELSELLFADSAYIQRAEKKIANSAPSDYSYKPVDRFIPIAFNKDFELNERITVRLTPVGHILGAASVFVKVEEEGKTKTILFSGDVGRDNYPLLPDPEQSPQADYVLCETTYGNRVHKETEPAEEIVKRIVTEACVDKPGRLIIPAFSLGRTQSLLYTLNKLALKNELPPIKVFTDSALAAEGTNIYSKYSSLMNGEALAIKAQDESLFDFENLDHVKTFKESKNISNYLKPCIILSSSGMITGGRIQHHIRQNIQNPYCTILLVGYAVEGTIGHDLLAGKQTIRFKKRSIPVAAKIIYTDIFSGHTDVNGLIKYLGHQDKAKLKKIFLVHGEHQSMLDFEKRLHEEGYNNIEIPDYGQSYDL